MGLLFFSHSSVQCTVQELTDEKLEIKPEKGTSCLVFTTDCLIQGKGADEEFFLQVQESTCLQALILIEDFNYPDICWKSGMANCKHSSGVP